MAHRMAPPAGGVGEGLVGTSPSSTPRRTRVRAPVETKSQRSFPEPGQVEQVNAEVYQGKCKHPSILGRLLSLTVIYHRN